METEMDGRESEVLSAEELFRRYYTRLCHFAFQLLNDHVLAEDIVQDAFVAYWNHKEMVSPNAISIRSFLYTSIRNSCYNMSRRKKVVERYMQMHSVDIDGDETALNAIIRAEVIAEVTQAINTLPEGCRQVFRLGYLEGLNNSKIAEVLDISINTVKTQKQRGMKALRALLRPELLSILGILFYG